MRVAIVGTRRLPTFYGQWKDNYGRLMQAMRPGTVASGGAVGFGTYARPCAARHKLKLLEYKPEYPEHGRGVLLQLYLQW